MDLAFLETVLVLFGGAEARDIALLRLGGTESVILETDCERGTLLSDLLWLLRREGFRLELLLRGEISDLKQKNIYVSMKRQMSQ